MALWWIIPAVPCTVIIHCFPGRVFFVDGVTKHRTGPKYRSIRYKKGSNRRVQTVNTCDASTSSIATALRSRGSPIGHQSLSLVRFAAAARSTVDCQRAIGRFSLFSWIHQWYNDTDRPAQACTLAFLVCHPQKNCKILSWERPAWHWRYSTHAARVEFY